MTKGKSKTGGSALKAPKPAVAKPGVVKPLSKAGAKPVSVAKPFSKGKENNACAEATSSFEQAGKRAKAPEPEQAEPKRKRERNQPTRFGTFITSPGSLSFASPASQSGVQNRIPEPVGAEEARAAEQLNAAAAQILGQYLDDVDEGPNLKERMAPMIEQMHADRAIAAKTKAEAKQKAQEAAEKFVPVDQRKLPSPIKRCPQLERARADLLHNRRDRKSTIRAAPSGESHNPSLQPRAVDSDQELQAAKFEISNLRAQLMLQEDKVADLKREQEDKVAALKREQEDKVAGLKFEQEDKVADLKCEQDMLRRQNEELSKENIRLMAQLAEAQSTSKKVAKAKKDQNSKSAELKVVKKEMYDLEEQQATFNANMESLKNRLEEQQATFNADMESLKNRVKELEGM